MMFYLPNTHSHVNYVTVTEIFCGGLHNAKFVKFNFTVIVGKNSMLKVTAVGGFIIRQASTTLSGFKI